ncbi:MAG TPA: DNA polymerase III subunit gamma and tau [Actinocatenispora sp.]
MANIALYRKYRSRTFAEVIGQEHVTEPLIAALRNGKLNHAYLFSGPRGCGKTSSARILARSVNCAKGPTPEPCGECESCRALAPNGPGSIDVIEIDAASHGGVDDARELREKAFFAPVNSRYKVYVIDEAHMVSSAGFNALLKLVEEPPEYVMFIFATTEPDKVLGTIKSRTHHYPFRLVPPGTMREHLERVCGLEGVQVDPAVYPLVVRAGGGSVRDSMSIMDQLMAGAGDEGVTYQRAVGLLGVTDAGLLDEAVDALAGADGAALFGAVDRVVEAGHDPRRFASDLLERLRDLIVLNQVPDAAANGLIAVPPDELERLTSQAVRLGPATLSRMADILHDGLTDMRGATSPRLVLEVLCARMLLPGGDSTADLLQRLETLEQRVATGVPVAPPGAAAPPAPPAPAVAPPLAPSVPPAASASPMSGGPAPSASAATASPAPAGPAPAATAPPVSAEPTVPAPAVPPPGGSAPAGSVREAGVSSASAAGSEPAPAATPPAPAATPAPPPAPALPPAVGGEVDIQAVARAWEPIVEHTKRRRVVWSLLQNAAPYALDGDTLVLKARNAGIAGRFNDDTVVGVLQDALQAVLGRKWRIRCQANPSAPAQQERTAAPPPAPPAAPPAQAAPPTVDGWPEAARPGGTVAPPPPPAPEPPRSAGGGQTATALAEPRGAVATKERPQTAEPEWQVPDGPTDFSPDDPVPANLGGYDGFAPGDEPTDEPLDPAKALPSAAATAEEQALSLLVQNLGAEKIGEA